jgi:hypothetical protein
MGIGGEGGYIAEIAVIADIARDRKTKNRRAKHGTEATRCKNRHTGPFCSGEEREGMRVSTRFMYP